MIREEPQPIPRRPDDYAPGIVAERRHLAESLAGRRLPHLVGTVGGGTSQGTAAECLDVLGCRGAGRARRFAEIVGAAVLAGDLSLMAAFCSHELVGAHERLGRNRP